MIRPIPAPQKNPLVTTVGNGSSTVTISGPSITADCLGNGSVTIGDVNANGNGTRLFIDDSVPRIAMLSSTGVVDSSSGVVSIGDFNGAVNSTLLVVDDTNSRVVVGPTTAKFVLKPDGLYTFDAGTSTYWHWRSVSGAWTGTDTTSAALP